MQFGYGIVQTLCIVRAQRGHNARTARNTPPHFVNNVHCYGICTTMMNKSTRQPMPTPPTNDHPPFKRFNIAGCCVGGGGGYHESTPSFREAPEEALISSSTVTAVVTDGVAANSTAHWPMIHNLLDPSQTHRQQ